MEFLLNSKQTADLANLLDAVSAQVRLGSGYRNEAGYWATQVGPDLKADDMQRIGWLLEDAVGSAWLPEAMQQWATAWRLTILELTSGQKALQSRSPVPGPDQREPSRPCPSPGTVVIYTDVVCARSTVALHRFYQQRGQAGLEDRVRVEHRLFLLEDVIGSPSPSATWMPRSRSWANSPPQLEWKPWQNHPSP